MSKKFFGKRNAVPVKFTAAQTIKIILVLFICSVCIALVLLLFQLKKMTPSNERDLLPSVKIAPENLCLPDNPLSLPPIQFSREQRKTWSDRDIEMFFVDPKSEAGENLHKKNAQKIQDLLEGVP